MANCGQKVLLGVSLSANEGSNLTFFLLLHGEGQGDVLDCDELDMSETSLRLHVLTLCLRAEAGGLATVFSDFDLSCKSRDVGPATPAVPAPARAPWRTTGFGLDCGVSLRDKSPSTDSLLCENRLAEIFKLATLFVTYCCNELKKLIFARCQTKRNQTEKQQQK